MWEMAEGEGAGQRHRRQVQRGEESQQPEDEIKPLGLHRHGDRQQSDAAEQVRDRQIPLDIHPAVADLPGHNWGDPQADGPDRQ